MLPRTLFCSVAAGLLSQAALAEDDLYFGELPIVASVSRLPQRLSEAPGSVTVIDREMIRASGFRTVEDLLRLVPGFQVSSHNQDPALVAYHGLTGGMNTEEYTPRVQVLIDGRSQYSPLFKSGVNWNLLPVVLENIERIEVTRGSNTVTYGSNAALGVINIITQDTSQTKGWLVSANRGVNQVRDETLRWGGKVGEADVRFTAHQVGDNGVQQAKYGASWYPGADSRRSEVFDLKADLALSARDELQFSLSQAGDKSQIGRSNGDLKYPLWYLTTSSTALGLQWRRIESANEEFKLRYNYTQDRSSGSYVERSTFSSYSSNGTQNAIGFNLIDAGGSSQVHELEFEHIKPLAEQTRLVWGMSGKSIALSSLLQFSSTQWLHRTVYRTFGNVEHRPSQDWLFNLGASLEQDSLSGLQFDPRLSASYHLNADNTLRAVASRAHRTPSLYEYMGRIEKFGVDPITSLTIKNLEYLGQGVTPERIDTLEFGYLGEWKALRASLDVRAFREHVPNRIQIVPMALPASSPDDHDGFNGRNGIGSVSNTLYPNGRADGAVNFENVVIRGYEYQARWQPFESTRLIYSNSFVTITADPYNVGVVADSLGDNTDKISRQTRESAPVRAQSAMLIQRLPYDVQASVMYFQSGPLRWRRNAPAMNDATERFDWRLAKSFRIGSSRAELAYTVQMANESQQGRQVYRLADKINWLSLRLEY
jgi:iron complex outermembrane receptor protein